MRSISIGQRVALTLCILGVSLVLFVRARSINVRLARAGRLYDAGRIREGDRTMAAVERAHANFYRQFPGWRSPAGTGAAA